MVTELDYGVGNVTAALKATGVSSRRQSDSAPSLRSAPHPLLTISTTRPGKWDNSVIFMIADNGAQMDHGYNCPKSRQPPCKDMVSCDEMVFRFRIVSASLESSFEW